MTKLVKKAKKHDSDAFIQLFDMHREYMYKVAISIVLNDDDAGDAIQETILNCWEKIHGLKNDELFKTWMTRILINNCYDILKAKRNMVEMEDVEEPYSYDSYNLELKEALSALDVKYRLPITLFYGEGYKVAEISKILKTPESTIQTRLQRGREQLKVFMESGKEERGYGRKESV